MAQLILLGQGPSMHDCPFDTETWASVSVLSHNGFEDKPYSKVFCFDKPEKKDDELAGLKVALSRNIPIVGLDWLHTYDPITDAFVTEPYPLRELQKKFDTFYFKNDMSYMIAYALHLGYKDLLLWGVDQGGDDDDGTYVMARPYVMFWLGVATGMGVRWDLAPDSILLRSDN